MLFRSLLLEKTGAVLEEIRSSERLSVEKALYRLGKIARRAQLDRDDVKMLHGLLKEISRSGRD